MNPRYSLALLAAVVIAQSATTSVNASEYLSIDNAVKQVEANLAAKVGLFILDTRDNRTWHHRADDRFPMASTFKVLACGALLDKGADVLNRKIVIQKSDLLDYVPVTSGMVGSKVTASDLCGITMRTSDNTAANKVLDVLGGPPSVTAFLRKVGDQTTRLDRNEPSLNEGAPGDARDTTTPRAMATTLANLVLGTALDLNARRQLTRWLESNEVGGPLLRAGVPPDWRVADRTGAGGHGTRGLVAVMWPPKRAPIVATIYITQTRASMDERNAAIASIGKAIAAEVMSRPIAVE